MKTDIKWTKVAAILFVVFIFIVFLLTINLVIGMLIDHNCYQLVPNLNTYNHTVCERYWGWGR